MTNSVKSDVIIFMTTRELLEVLNNTKTAKALELARNPPPPPAPLPPPEINWIERTMEKNTLMKKHIKNLLLMFGFVAICFVLPVYVAFPEIGRSMLLGIPPMIFIALTWMAGAWYAWDKEFPIFMAMTLGAMPLRIGIGMVWSIFVFRIPALDIFAYFVGMMVFWVAFTFVEVYMLNDFSNKLPKTGAQVEP